MTNFVNRIDGRWTDAAVAGKDSLFTADLTAAERTAFNVATPNRVAYKHAHSEQNPERDWGKNTLQAVVFAFYVLNEQFGRRRLRAASASRSTGAIRSSLRQARRMVVPVALRPRNRTNMVSSTASRWVSRISTRQPIGT